MDEPTNYTLGTPMPHPPPPIKVPNVHSLKNAFTQSFIFRHPLGQVCRYLNTDNLCQFPHSPRKQHAFVSTEPSTQDYE